MNLVLLFEEDFIESSKARIRGARLEHVTNVLRAEEGDSIRVGKLGGRMGAAIIRAINDTEILLETDLAESPPQPSNVTLLLALPRPKVLSRVLISATVMGVKRIVLFDCWRVEKSFWKSPRLAEDRIVASLIAGLEQARDTVLPTVRFERRFTPFVEDVLPQWIGGKNAIVAHPNASSAVERQDGEIVLAIGPEGGFIPNEVEMMQRIGFTPMSLGSRILHVEAAVPALLARLGSMA